MIHALGVLASIKPIPYLSVVSNTENRAIGCGATTWRRDVSWILSFYDDTNYYIEIYDEETASVAATGLTTTSSPYVHDTGKVGLSGGTGTFHYSEYTVRLKRVSDDVIVSTMTTPQEFIESGPPC